MALPFADLLTFRPMSRGDFEMLYRWMHMPHVSAWWRPLDPPEIEARYGPRIDGTSPTRMFVIEVGGRPVGLIQSYRVADYPAWDRTLNISGAAGIDYLIGDPADCGRGLGSRAIAQFSRAVFDAYSDVSVIAVAPQAANTASCRALANAGFTFLGLRDLESDDPSEAGPSAIHVLRLDTPPTASA